MQPLYFTFLDGAFRYDCAACGQACCRGKGVAIDARRDLVPLLRRAPQLSSLLTPLAGGYVRLPDVTDGCWFLRGDGLCSYEVAHGRDAKFTTCRLFPFNRVFRAGALTVVDFNSVVCPLKDAHGSGQGVGYRELQSELAAVGDGPLTATPLPLPDGARELRWPALEQALLDASADALAAESYLPYAAHQLDQTRRHLGLRGDTEPALASLSRLLSLWEAILGEPPASRQATTRGMALLTASLRFNSLFRRAAPAFREGALRQPGQLLAGWFLACLAAAAYANDAASPDLAGPPQPGRALSLRGLTELYQAQAPLRDLLARIDQPALLTAPLPTEDLPKDLAATAQRLSNTLQRVEGKKSGAPPSLGQVLQPLSGELARESRALLPALLLRAGDALKFTGPS